jgi:DNA-directed RNA polymerase subunit RPC12/RpoP
MSRKITRFLPPVPPVRDQLPLVNASPVVALWLDHYWRKLSLPVEQAQRLAVTDDRAEFARWTGRRLNPMALGCYCFLPLYDGDAPQAEPAASANLRAPANEVARLQPTLPGFADNCDSGEANREIAGMDASSTPLAPATLDATDRPPDFRHLIFVEPDLLVEGIEVTVAHELIHLADRVAGAPRKHHCHGRDSISQDEAALTARDPEWLRELLAEETRRREGVLRKARPYRYLYVCLNCGKEYPRVKKYSRPVSCGHCDQRFNAAFLLHLHPLATSSTPTADGRAFNRR